MFVHLACSHTDNLAGVLYRVRGLQISVRCATRVETFEADTWSACFLSSKEHA